MCQALLCPRRGKDRSMCQPPTTTPSLSLDAQLAQFHSQQLSTERQSIRPCCHHRILQSATTAAIASRSQIIEDDDESRMASDRSYSTL